MHPCTYSQSKPSKSPSNLMYEVYPSATRVCQNDMHLPIKKTSSQTPQKCSTGFEQVPKNLGLAQLNFPSIMPPLYDSQVCLFNDNCYKFTCLIKTATGAQDVATCLINTTFSDNYILCLFYFQFSFKRVVLFDLSQLFDAWVYPQGLDPKCPISFVMSSMSGLVSHNLLI